MWRSVRVVWGLAGWRRLGIGTVWAGAVGKWKHVLCSVAALRCFENLVVYEIKWEHFVQSDRAQVDMLQATDTHPKLVIGLFVACRLLQ